MGDRRMSGGRWVLLVLCLVAGFPGCSNAEPDTTRLEGDGEPVRQGADGHAILGADVPSPDRPATAPDVDAGAAMGRDGAAPPEAAASDTVPVPMFVTAYVSGPLDSIYNAEYQRLGDVCQGEPDTCWAENLDTTAVRLARYWPDAEAEAPAGWLAARLRPLGRWPYAAMVVQPSEGRETTVLDDLGDWGYGMTLPVRAFEGDRFQPWLLGDVGGWLDVDGGPGFGIVEGPFGLEGRLWQLGPTDIPGTGGEEEALTLADGVYMVLSVVNGVVQLRPEVRSDMDCGGDERELPENPPVHDVPLERLLDADGRPQVEVAYGKGC